MYPDLTLITIDVIKNNLGCKTNVHLNDMLNLISAFINPAITLRKLHVISKSNSLNNIFQE